MIYGYIYRLKSKTNGKCYIGQTTDNEPYHYIYSSYKTSLGRNRPKLNNHIKKYGFSDLRVDIIDAASNQEELDNFEREYIAHFDCVKNGLNCRDGGSRGKHSEETIKKISLSAKGRDTSKAVAESIKSRKGKPSHNRRFIKLENRVTNEVYEGFMDCLCKELNINKRNLSCRGYTTMWKITK